MTVLARARVVLEGDAAGLHAVFSEAETALRSVGRRMADVGRDLTTKLSLPLLGVGTAATHAAADFDKTMRKMVALAGVSAQQVEEWKSQVRSMAVEFGSTGTAAADALMLITSAGVEGERAMTALEAALKGSAVGLGDAKVVADATTAAMNAYSKQGLTAARASDILAAGVKFGRFEAENLAPVLGQLTGTASALNISFADVVGTMAVFSRTGTDASEGATQLSSIMSMLLGTSDEGEKLLTGAGLSLEKLREVASGPRGLINVMRLLDQSFGGNLEKLRTIIPNVRAFRGVMNALAQQESVVNSIVDGTVNSVGFLDRALVEVNGPAFKMQQAWSRIKDSLIAAGNVLLPVVIPAMQKVSEVIRATALAFSNLTPFAQKAILTFAALAVSIGPVLIALGTFAKVIGFMRISALIGSVSMLGRAFTGLWAAAKGWVFMSGIQGAFAAAAVAGTGFRGVLAGLVPLLKATWAAFAPFLAGAVIVVGLGAIVAKWVEMKIAVSQVNAALAESKKHMDGVLSGMSKNQAAAAYTRLALIVQNLQGRIAELKKKEDEQRAAANESARTSGYAAAANLRLAETYKNQREELQASVDQYRHQLGILGQVVVKQEEVKTVVQQGTIAVAKQVPWINAAKDAWKELSIKLRSATEQEKLLGPAFDETKEKAKAYKEAIEALTEAGVPFNAVIGSNGETLFTLGNRLRMLDAQIKHAETSQDTFNETLRTAEQAVKAALTPQQEFNNAVAALNVAVEAGKITWAEYDAAVKTARDTMNESIGINKELKQAMTDLAKDGVSGFVDAVFDAKTNWGDFFRTMLHDIAKLIIKMYILNALFPKGPGGEAGKFLGGILGFADGGFLGPGGVGVVGERGPEFISGGRNGLTVTPMPAVGAADGSGMGQVVKVEVNVNAIDSRDVTRFFEENEGLVAGAMLRAHQKSSLLRRL